VNEVFKVLVGIVFSDRDVVDYRAWATATPGFDVVAIQKIRMRVGEPIVVFGSESDLQLRLGEEVKRRVAQLPTRDGSAQPQCLGNTHNNSRGANLCSV